LEPRQSERGRESVCVTEGQEGEEKRRRTEKTFCLYLKLFIATVFFSHFIFLELIQKGKTGRAVVAVLLEWRES